MIPILPEQFLICRKDEESGLPPSVVAIAHPFASHRHPAYAVPSGRARLAGNVRARMAQHHHRVARGAHKVVTLLVHPAILAMVKPVFVKPIGKVLENLEAPALHPNQHVLNASLERHRAILELCVGVEHVEPLRRVLLGQRNAGAFQGLPATVTRPGPRQIAPRLERRSVNDCRRLAQTVGPADIDRVGVAIPYQLDRRKGVIPTKVHPTDARPMPGKFAVLNRERLLLHRENAAAAENRNTLGARLVFVRRIAGCDPHLVRLGKVRRVVNRRTNHGAVGMRCTAARKEALDDSAHPEQGCKAQIYCRRSRASHRRIAVRRVYAKAHPGKMPSRARWANGLSRLTRSVGLGRFGVWHRYFVRTIAQLSVQLFCPAHLAGLRIVRPWGNISRLLCHLEPLMHLAQVALRALAFGYVAMDDGHANHVPTRVSNWPRADPNLDQTSVFASTRRFEINLLALKYALDPSSWRIVRGIGSEKAKRLTNRFGRCVAVELLSGRVPCLNSCARIDAENSIHRRSDNCG